MPLPKPTIGSQVGPKGAAPVVKRKRGRPPKIKRPRPTALSTFATKKRAMSRSPSPPSDLIDEPSMPKKIKQKALNTAKEEIQKWQSKNSSKNSQIKPISLRPQGKAVTLPKSNNFLLDDAKNDIRLEKRIEKELHSHNPTNTGYRSGQLASKPGSTTNIHNAVNERRETLRTFSDSNSLKINLDRGNPTGSHLALLSNGKESFDNTLSLNPLLTHSTRLYDDDQLSVTSSSTNSTNCSNQQTSSRLTRKHKLNLQDKEESQSVFRFNDLFSFFPPKLVVRDGELVPEHSLSVKKVERSTLSRLPESHPFFKWNLGRPVTNQSQRTQNRNGRKRKAAS